MEKAHRSLPPLGTLRAFEAAARLLSFTRAAEELHISQAAISKQIQRLEDSVNTPLFTRQHRTLLLTPAGHVLFATTSSALAELAACAATLRAESSNEPVTIGLSVGMATHRLMPRLGEFRALHPDIDVRVLAVDRDIDPQAEGVDIAIGYANKRNVASSDKILCAEEMLPVCSPNFPLAQARTNLALLAQTTLLHLDPDHWQDLPEPPIDWPQWLAHFGIELSPAPKGLLINNYVMLLQAALDGQGVALGWRPIVDPLLENGLLMSASDCSWATGRCHYLRMASQNPRHSVAVFRDWLLINLCA